MLITPTNSLNYDVINNTVMNAIQRREELLRTTITSMGDNPTTAQMVALQQQVQTWSIMAQIQTTLTKELSDSMESALQKIN